jgi:outer membrane protein OmpA-like peptidoglycan-associated protein
MKNLSFFSRVLLFGFLVIILSGVADTSYADYSKEDKEKELQSMQEQFKWWPTDAQPAPVKDSERGGYWWMPNTPGEARPWGNRGYIYVYKIIFDYNADELPAPKDKELRPSLLIKKILKNVKIYFDLDKAQLRSDALNVLENAVKTLDRNPETDMLITGNCDMRGSEAYNNKLGRRRAEAIKNFMLQNDVPSERIRIISRGKLDAVAPVEDLVGMQKDRNAQFMIAQVEEVMIPYQSKDGAVELPPPDAKLIEEGKYIEETEESVESEIKVSTKEYIVKPNDTLSKIAQNEYGGAHRWKYLYEFNKDRIKNPNNLKVVQKILIPVE